MSTSRRQRAAFTLMEVLLVLVILVVLAGMATFAIRRAQTEAYNNAARTQIGAFKQSLEAYQIDMNSYPTSDQGLNALVACPADARNPQKWKGPYSNMNPIPKDPWGSDYLYTLQSSEQFTISSPGADLTPDTPDDITQ